MFHIDATFEDCNINASSPNGFNYDCNVRDKYTGESRQVSLSAAELSMVLQFCLHPDGEPDGFQEFYKVLEPKFEGWPVSLRPIP